MPKFQSGLWCQTPCARVSIEDTYAEALGPEEAPADVRARRIPSSWIDGVARLDHHRPLSDIAPHRWRQFLIDCNNFLTGGENWAGRAAELGWNAASRGKIPVGEEVRCTSTPILASSRAAARRA
jgi:hypothetical protein